MQGRGFKFTMGIRNWTNNAQQLSTNYANSPLILLTNTLEGFDIFENNFRDLPKSPSEQQQLTAIRNSLVELVERKKREMEPQPSVEPTLMTESISPQSQSQFAAQINEWASKYEQLSQDLANRSLAAIFESAIGFNKFAANALINPAQTTAMEQAQLAKLREQFDELLREREKLALREDPAAQFRIRLNEWASRYEQFSNNLANTPLTTILQSDFDFTVFEASVKNINKTAEEQNKMNEIKEGFNALATKKREEQRSNR